MPAGVPEKGKLYGGSRKARAPDEVVVLDLSPADASREIVHRIFVLPGCLDSPFAGFLWTELGRQFDTTGNHLSLKADALGALLFRIGDRLAELSSNRWISSKGDHIDVYLLHAIGLRGKIDFQEKARKTRIASDLIVLAQLAAKIAKEEPDAFVPPQLAVTKLSWVLGQKRATLTITGSTLKDTTQTGASTPDNTPPTGPEKLETTIVTGPAEHLFLSANVGVTSAKQITYEESSRSLGPAKKPDGFLVALNVSLADPDAKPREKNPVKRFVRGMYAAGFVKASQRPFDQLGLLVGFRRIPWAPLSKVISLQAVSPFIGVNWARKETVSGPIGEQTIGDRYGSGKFIWGLSLNLNKALDWVGG